MPEKAASAAVALGERTWELPPLILHPFSTQQGPGQLLEGSKAALKLAGLLPVDEDRDELRRKLLLSRYAEVRMLFFVGKDLLRWMGQCEDLVSRTGELGGLGIRQQSFGALLVYNAPKPVLEKLRQWGVANPQSVFSRALGIACLLREMPTFEHLAEGFLLSYHSFADHIFVCALHLTPFTEITAANFQFELYASGEYLRMLEKEWGE